MSMIFLFSCVSGIHIISRSCNHLAFFYFSLLNWLLINFKPSGIHSYLGHGLFVFFLNAFFKLRGLWCAAHGISPHSHLCAQPCHRVWPPRKPSVHVCWMNEQEYVVLMGRRWSVFRPGTGRKLLHANQNVPIPTLSPDSEPSGAFCL